MAITGTDLELNAQSQQMTQAISGLDIIVRGETSIEGLPTEKMGDVSSSSNLKKAA